MRNKGLTSFILLQHILEAINIIEQVTENCNKEKFLTDLKINNSVMLQFMIIGEAIINVEEKLLHK